MSSSPLFDFLMHPSYNILVLCPIGEIRLTPSRWLVGRSCETLVMVRLVGCPSLFATSCFAVGFEARAFAILGTLQSSGVTLDQGTPFGQSLRTELPSFTRRQKLYQKGVNARVVGLHCILVDG
ncbi:hypothetical protein BHE74_00059882 [Ensete ventricosum]|nr:hypothetical protein BHE74_00059882 [Ensete ventricosum]